MTVWPQKRPPPPWASASYFAWNEDSPSQLCTFSTMSLSTCDSGHTTAQDSKVMAVRKRAVKGLRMQRVFPTMQIWLWRLTRNEIEVIKREKRNEALLSLQCCHRAYGFQNAVRHPVKWLLLSGTGVNHPHPYQSWQQLLFVVSPPGTPMISS